MNQIADHANANNPLVTAAILGNNLLVGGLSTEKLAVLATRVAVADRNILAAAQGQLNQIANHVNHGIVSDTKVVTNPNTATPDLTTIANRCLPPLPAVLGVAPVVGGEYFNNNNIHDVNHILGRIVEHPNVDPVLQTRIHQALLAGLQASTLPPTVLTHYNLGALPVQSQHAFVPHADMLRGEQARTVARNLDPGVKKVLLGNILSRSKHKP